MLNPNTVASAGPGGFLNLDGGAVDPYYAQKGGVPHVDAQAACDAVPTAARRYRTVNVAGTEYWWLASDLSNDGLVIKTAGSGGGDPTLPGRVATLETDLDQAENDLNAVENELADLVDEVISLNPVQNISINRNTTTGAENLSVTRRNGSVFGIGFVQQFVLSKSAFDPLVAGSQLAFGLLYRVILADNSVLCVQAARENLPAALGTRFVLGGGGSIQTVQAVQVSYTSGAGISWSPFEAGPGGTGYTDAQAVLAMRNDLEATGNLTLGSEESYASNGGANSTTLLLHSGTAGSYDSVTATPDSLYLVHSTTGSDASLALRDGAAVLGNGLALRLRSAASGDNELTVDLTVGAGGQLLANGQPVGAGAAVPVRDVYDVAETIRTAVAAGGFSGGELQGDQPVGSESGMKFTTAAYGYEYQRGAAGTLVWCRYPKG